MESSTSNLMLTMKFLLISIGAVSSAIAIKSSVPLILYEFPTIWSILISWLKPPYLYILLNGIIIIIAATSRSNRKEQQQSSEQSRSLISAGTPPVYSDLVTISRYKMSEYASELVDEPEVFEVMPLISAGTPPVNSDLVTISRSKMCEYALELVDEPKVFEEKTEPVIEPPEVVEVKSMVTVMNEDEGENDEFVSSNSVYSDLVTISRSKMSEYAPELVDEPEVFEVMPLITAGTPPVNSDLVEQMFWVCFGCFNWDSFLEEIGWVLGYGADSWVMG
ncbi:hypothetical protein R3W88_015130 [Solanum pinnatisectum]|uniref:DUF4408 domain-containing protein n=1 Tax=Solanum pinnatisectum TaxID=50273 RepID=A0AAV9KUT5_9SOLN|nr:hypothetical protein R3W88_015130 [Solanum pinnatisectum]